MIPNHLHHLFWDIDVQSFVPEEYPDYTIGRVLEFGDQAAYRWLKDNYPEDRIKITIRGEGRLTRKTATFWALVYDIPPAEVSSLR
jgi:hypothetical protein